MAVKAEIESLVRRNPSLTGLKCLRCEKSYKVDDPHIDSGLGCRDCYDAGFPAGLHCVYDASKKLEIDHSKSGMLRFASRLPFLDFPSLGEGQTPSLPLHTMASDLGVEKIFVKNEGQNPTGSHKDRMSPLAVARAVSIYNFKVVASSSGNAGASLASYAARARIETSSGVDCCIVAGTDISAPWANAIKLAGAELRLMESDQRWQDVRRLVQEEGWFPVTNFSAIPIGSNPFGIEGYKTIAHEIALQDSITRVIIPTCRGDVLLGLWLGFVEAREANLIETIPQLVAVEPGPRLERVLDGSDYRSVFSVPANNMTSIDGGTATYQSFAALKATGGMAVSVTSQQCMQAQHDLAKQGFHVEMSSAASLAGLLRLKTQNLLQKNDRVVLLATSHGYKEPLDSNVDEKSQSL